LLIRKSPAAKQAFQQVVVVNVKQEIADVKRNYCSLKIPKMELTMNNLELFEWQELVDEAREITPWMITLLNSMLPSPSLLRRHFHKGSGKHRR
jgi:hypothetical protein